MNEASGAGGVDRAAAGLSVGPAGAASSRPGVLAVWSPCRGSRLPGRQTATPPGSAAAGRTRLPGARPSSSRARFARTVPGETAAPTGLKIAIFGLGGYGALGGFVGSVGGTIIGGVLGLPSLLVWVDGPAYRKSVPTVIMLMARTRVKLGQQQRAGEASDGLITAA